MAMRGAHDHGRRVRTKRSRLLALVVGLAAFVPVGLGVLDEREALPVESAEEQHGRLESVGCSARSRSGFVVVVGSIRNVGHTPAERVEVVAELADAEGVPLDRGSALVRSVNISPGAQSPFRIVIDDAGRGVLVTVRTRPLRWDALTPPFRSSASLEPSSL